MARKKVLVSQRDLEFILGNSFHRLMVEVARVKKSRKKSDSSLDELAHYFFSNAVYRQTGLSATRVKFPRPWSYNKAVAWLAHYAEETSTLMDDKGIAPLLMEVALAPYPLCKRQGLFVEARPDLIARRVPSGDLTVLDYKTVSPKRYFLFKSALSDPNLSDILHNFDQLVGYGAAAEHDVHEVNEPVDEIGLIVVPRTPLSEGNEPLPVLFLAVPFDRSYVEGWHTAKLDRILNAIAAEKKSND